MKFDIAIVIPAFNEHRDIEQTLSNFAKEANTRVLFIIVDNNSTDTTVAAIHRWHKNNPHQPLILLSEKRRGALHAKIKGIFYAKTRAHVVVSTDADCAPLPNFYRDVGDFFHNKATSVFAGHLQHDPRTRLLRQLYVPMLMDAIAWMEKIEKNIFGPFFFGGYFAIKSGKISPLIFSKKNIPIPDEPTIFWSKHCYYSNYKFSYSLKNMRTSSRRFWSDPYGYISLQHSKTVRITLASGKKQIKALRALKEKQTELITLRIQQFAHRFLMLFLDAIFFEHAHGGKKNATLAINRACTFLKIHPQAIRILTRYSFRLAKEKIVEHHLKHTISTLLTSYAHSR